MSEQTNKPAPQGIEAFFYVGVGSFIAFVVVATIGLSIYGRQTSADARSGRAEEVAVAQDTAGLDEGSRIYGQRCASCHGAEGQGGVGPSFVGVTERIPAAADHEAIVRDGQKQMPSFGGILDDEQIGLVVRFEREVLDGG